MVAAIVATVACCRSVSAQELIHFPTLPASSMQLDGYLWQPTTPGPHPAVVLLHGCGGLLSRSTHMPDSRAKQWAKLFNEHGYVALAVDSFTPRGVKNMCSPSTLNQAVYGARRYDAYAALAYLQSQAYVDGARVAVMARRRDGLVRRRRRGPPFDRQQRTAQTTRLCRRSRLLSGIVQHAAPRR
ncbi:MAG: hypothetical protein ABSE64_02955 [Vulcanimicrobiaceae bacterium]